MAAETIHQRYRISVQRLRLNGFHDRTRVIAILTPNEERRCRKGGMKARNVSFAAEAKAFIAAEVARELPMLSPWQRSLVIAEKHTLLETHDWHHGKLVNQCEVERTPGSNWEQTLDWWWHDVQDGLQILPKQLHDDIHLVSRYRTHQAFGDQAFAPDLRTRQCVGTLAIPYRPEPVIGVLPDKQEILERFVANLDGLDLPPAWQLAAATRPAPHHAAAAALTR